MTENYDNLKKTMIKNIEILINKLYLKFYSKNY